MEKVSVIVPCFNVEKTMLRALNSIREQEYSNLEVLIVNDGSTDSTKSIAERYTEIDSRFKLINIKHGGVSLARNTGIDASTGEYITFIDGDDNYTTPYAISNMMNGILSNKADICACNFKNKWLNSYYKDACFNLKDATEFAKFYQTDVAVVWNKIYKKSIITHKFHEELKENEDKIFILENLTNCKVAVTIQSNLLNYISKKDTEWVDAYNQSGADCILSRIFENSFSPNLMKYKKVAFKKFSVGEEILKDYDLINEFFHDLALLYYGDVATLDLIQFCKIHLYKKEFLDLFERKNAVGLKFIGLDEERINKFVKLISYAYNDIASYNKRLSTYLISISLFSKVFFEIKENYEDSDLLVAMFSSTTSPEVKYVNNLLEISSLGLL